MTYTEKELDQFLHGISLSLLSKKSAQHWRYDEETAKEIEWLEALERKVRADKADRKTEPLSKAINGVKIDDAVAWADKWLEDNPVSEMWDMIRTLRDATEWQDEPQTEEPTMNEYYKDHDEFYDCDRYVVTNDEGERAYNCIGCEQTDCPWK